MKKKTRSKNFSEVLNLWKDSRPESIVTTTSVSPEVYWIEIDSKIFDPWEFAF